MGQIKILKSNAARRACSIGAAIIIAVVVNYYFASTHEGWIILAAFLVTQTTRGTPLRRGLINFFLTMMIVIVLSFINPINSLQDRFLEVVIGGFIGLWCAQVILPVNFQAEFKDGLIPLFEEMKCFSQILMSYIEEPAAKLHLIREAQVDLEKALQTRRANYPEWVYETGFNPGLRKGFRFFLINSERLTEILFSTKYLATSCADDDALKNLAPAFAVAMKKNEELMQVIIHYFQTNELEGEKSDYASDLNELESAVREVVPSSLELLDISHDYVVLTALARNIKDMRGILLQLVLSLPAK